MPGKKNLTPASRSGFKPFWDIGYNEVELCILTYKPGKERGGVVGKVKQPVVNGAYYTESDDAAYGDDKTEAFAAT